MRRVRQSPLGLFPGQLAPRLYGRLVEVLRTQHYSRRTEETYLRWIRRFFLGHRDVQTPATESGGITQTARPA